ncbi:hypothetical protein ASPVEDRAFT_40868 [Aspergillus versicolor CBS 583.65]|uniref:Glycosyl hydrolase family 13 catalytic domain-containing protein n=1 Tax=Aspergillus versicolor CBS 583.65 TaxID=1036611 RepID=A0A1L9PIM5_ASPVE|nr:uncharacterized protein ASPVEDRAFT_40868 [Aspergillus versicolor CBS 583.65]OJJ01313.1 hypothetical protein ASPVEDRAFT_40868 [Aspergillus versicolor CBS 583.65]
MSPPWWKEATIYQIYPASFLDTTGTGLGDIRGIISKIPYIRSLGVDALWLSPIFASPQHDMGYDVADYRAIHEPYGSVNDVQELIDTLHESGMRLLLDLVVNQTSSEHAWFKESRSSKSSSKRDWYIWRDPKYDSSGQRKPPNNWKSLFGGSAWQFDSVTGQYYLALFLPEQPDLNWENEAMRQAAYGDMRFWLDRGVDGFRIDSMNLMSKHPGLPDGKIVDPGQEFQSGAEFFASGPRMHEYLQEMRREVFDKYDRDIMTVGELGFTKDETSVAPYVASNRKELNMVFTGDISDMDFGVGHKYDKGEFHPRMIRRITNLWQMAMPKVDGWNAVYLDNHDSGRSLSRYASDAPEYRATAAKMLATYMMTLSGTPFLLAGQEIGMANLGREYGLDAYIDVEGRNRYNEIRGDPSAIDDFMRELQLKSRDHGRLPMQWDDSAHAGFTTADEPWMTVNRDYPEWNVAAQVDDPSSVMAFWKKMIALRKEYKELFVYGGYRPLDEEYTGEMVLGYVRESRSETAVVLLNFSDVEQMVGEEYQHYTVLVNESCRVDGRAILSPFGALVLYSRT